MTALERLYNAAVVPVVVLDDAADAVPTAKALLATSAEDEEVLSLQTLELDRTADTLVYRVFSHTLFIKGRMSAG